MKCFTYSLEKPAVHVEGETPDRLGLNLGPSALLAECSGLPSIADIGRKWRRIRDVPIADIGRRIAPIGDPGNVGGGAVYSIMNGPSNV